MKFSVLVFFILIISGCDKAKAMNIENPSYYLKLNMVECPRLVSVNGIEMERDFSGQTSFAEYPINHFIKNGSNTFELVVGEKEFMEENTSPNSECVAEILVKGKLLGEPYETTVANIVFTPKYTESFHDLTAKSMSAGEYSFEKSGSQKAINSNSDFKLGEIESGPLYLDGAGYTFVREFEARVPFKEWAFFSGEKIFDMPVKDDEVYDKNEKVVMAQLDFMRKLFESRSLDKIMPYFESRSAEIDQAFYKTSGSTLSEMKRSLEVVFKKDFPLHIHDDDNLQMIVSYDGKLVTMVDAGNMAGTIYFRDTEAGGFTFYTIYWMKKDGKWIVAR